MEIAGVMSIVEGFKRLLKALGAMVGHTAEAAPAPLAAPERIEPAFVFAETVPAVAAYERRIAPVSHHLAARLRSVAELNTKAGRVPYKAHRPLPVKPVATASRGGKKVRQIRGPVVLRPQPRQSAEIIALPVRPKPTLVPQQDAA